jgi:pyruvate kinase
VVTDNEIVMNQLQIFRGVQAFYVGTVLSTEPAMRSLIEYGKTLGLLVPGDDVVCISGNNFELLKDNSGYLTVLTVE